MKRAIFVSLIITLNLVMAGCMGMNNQEDEGNQQQTINDTENQQSDGSDNDGNDEGE